MTSCAVRRVETTKSSCKFAHTDLQVLYLFLQLVSKNRPLTIITVSLTTKDTGLSDLEQYANPRHHARLQDTVQCCALQQ